MTSLLRLQTSYSKGEGVEAVLSDSVERVMAMALVHEQLYLSETLSDIDFKDYAAGLIQSIRDTFELSGSCLQCEIEAEAVRLGLDTAVPLGLILNELLTNSVKYALPGKPRLSVRSGVKKLENALVFRYEDDGPGLPLDLNPDTEGNLGLTLIRALSQQLRGTANFPRNNGSGMAFELNIPLHY